MIDKKIVRDNPKEFGAWLRGIPVTLYSKSKKRVWTENYDWTVPEKHDNDNLFVILQDNYREFRTAIKMGEPIYHKDEGNKDVAALIRVGGFRNQPNDYSLIPFNEKVKVGDYVREKGSGDYYSPITDIHRLPYPEDMLEIWKPVIGDIMLFHTNGEDSTMAIIGGLDDITDDGFFIDDNRYDKVSPLTFSIIDYLDRGGVSIDDL